MQSNISIRLSTPFIRTAKCEHSERVQIIGGGSPWSGYVHLKVVELLPLEAQVCEVSFLYPERFASVKDWKASNDGEVWSPLGGKAIPRIYRVSQGPRMSTANPKYPYTHKVTFLTD